MTKIHDDCINKDNVTCLMDSEIKVKVCTQEAMPRCMHVLSTNDRRTISYSETDLNEKTLQSQWTMKYRQRSSKDYCIQEAMLRCMQVPIITAVGQNIPRNKKT